MIWIVLLALFGLVIGTGIYAQGRSRFDLARIRSWVGGVFFLLLALGALSIILDL